MAKIIEHVIPESGHSELSCSSSKRFIKCPGSIRLTRIIRASGRKDVGSVHAAGGTVAHMIGEEYFSNGIPPREFLGSTIKEGDHKIYVDSEMVEAVETYIEYIEDRVVEFSGQSSMEMLVEQWLSLSKYGIKGLDGGTGDMLLIWPKIKTAEVVDYKHGQGIAVDIVDDDLDPNSQLECYGLGTLLRLEESGIARNHLLSWDIILTVVQPRASHLDGPIRSVTLKGSDIYDWAESVLVPAAELAQTDDAPLQAGDWCKFCPAAGDCPELNRVTTEVAISEFQEIGDDICIPDPELLTSKQKLNIMKYSKVMTNFIIAVEASMKHEMESGSKNYNGLFKLVRKQTKRKFLEEAIDPITSPLLDHLSEEEMFKSTPKAMGEVEKILKKKLGKKNADIVMAEATMKPIGEIVIAPVSDKRREVEPSALSDFSDVG